MATISVEPPVKGAEADAAGALLVDHYQKTFEVTLAMWEQRNVTFLALLVCVGVATLLTFDVPQTQPLLVDLLAKLLSIEDMTRKVELRAGFPYGLLQSILLMAVLYLMLVLYHRTLFITRSYRYLHALELEIRATLRIPDTSVAFSREGRFYLHKRTPLSGAVAGAYVVMLGLLLLAFLGMRLVTDLRASSWFALGDLLLAVPTLVFFVAYAQLSLPMKHGGESRRREPKAVPAAAREGP